MVINFNDENFNGYKIKSSNKKQLQYMKMEITQFYLNEHEE